MCGPSNDQFFEDPDDEEIPSDETPANDETIPEAAMQPASLSDGPDEVMARFLTVLDCVSCKPPGGGKSSWMMVTFGADEGSVEQIAICEQDCLKLKRLLKTMIAGSGPPDCQGAVGATQPKEQSAARSRKRRRSRTQDAIWKAEARMKLEGPEQFIDRLLSVEPHLVRHCEEQTESLFMVLSRNCQSSAAAKRIARKMQRCLLIALHVARGIR